MNFLQAPDSQPVATSSDCILCELGNGGDHSFDQEHFILYRAKKCYIVLNAYPYAAGHLMVVPYLHLGDLLDFDPSVILEALELARRSVAVLRDVYNPEGFNFGANIGRAGGAAFGDHLHFHVVPRWLGDTNFMTTLASSRVIPEALSDTYKRLKVHFGA